MKYIVLIISLCLTSYTAQSQTVTIPDVNFKNALISRGVDTSNDSIIQVSEALAVTKLLVHGKSITNLTGIGAFTNLTYLACDTNQLTSLDVSLNIHLDTLNCNNNKLTSLDVTMLPLLSRLNCSTNKLPNLDVTKNLDLTWFDIGYNPIPSIDLSKNINLTSLDIVLCTSLTTIDLTNNINLETLLALLNNNTLLFLNVSYNTKLTTLNLSRFGTSQAKTICVNATQKAAIPSGWTKGSMDVYTTENCTVGIEELKAPTPNKQVLKICNLLGQEKSADNLAPGIYIYYYSDGTYQKKSVQ
jgi:hypothetical protein